MNITILEDVPWKMRECIKSMKKNGININRMIYFCEDDKDFQETEDKVKKQCEELNMDWIRVTSLNFDEVLDGFYNDMNNIFFFDMDLVGDFSRHFHERINVKYALKKRKTEKGKGKIWFYTTGPAPAREQINTYFPNRTLSVVGFDVDNKQIEMDIESIVERFGNG